VGKKIEVVLEHHHTLTIRRTRSPTGHGREKFQAGARTFRRSVILSAAQLILARTAHPGLDRQAEGGAPGYLSTEGRAPSRQSHTEI
jgi:hypothetical protein